MVGKASGRQAKKKDDDPDYVISKKKNNRYKSSSVFAPPNKKAKRKVQFDNNPPKIHDITPLTEKPPGIVRMPLDNPKSLLDDMESPIQTSLPVLKSWENVEQPSIEEMGSTDECSQQSVEVIDYSADQLTKKTNKQVNIIKNVPQIKLDDEKKQEEDIHRDSTNISKSLESNKNMLSEKHMMSNEELEAFTRGKMKRSMGHKHLWSRLFEPQIASDFFGKSQSDFQELREWLDQWRKQLSWLKQEETKKREENTRKRRRNKRLEEEEDDEDQDFQPDASGQLANPIILEGPTGCGKTTMVYAAAHASQFEVIELSAYKQRDGQTMKNKLAGAIESHNVKNQQKNGAQPDIRAMFSPSQTIRNKQEDGAEFTLILVDESDLIFTADHNFWSALRAICSESQIPIVLTCNDYELLGQELTKEPSGLDNYKTIHMERPTTQNFANYLRHWLFGFTGQYHKMGILTTQIEQKCQDSRAVLNDLHFGQMAATQAGDDEQNSPTMKETIWRLKYLAKLDAACGGHKSHISLLARQFADLNFSGSPLTRNENTHMMEEELEEERRELHSDLFKITRMNSEIGATDRDIVAKNVLLFACHRSKERLFSTRETSLDLLPCLLAIHRSHVHAANNSFRESRRAPPHPFDIVDPQTGTMIDTRQNLKAAITDFQIHSI